MVMVDSVSRITRGNHVTMAEKSIENRSHKTTFNEQGFIEIRVTYNNNEHVIEISNEADRITICNEIKRHTGVKGAFYLFNGGKVYLHSTSLTIANINKVMGEKLEVRGGNWANKGGDSIWYYYSQSLRPQVQQQLNKRQFDPIDKPP